jgi:3-methyladenine DNA glycosylase AlkD
MSLSQIKQDLKQLADPDKAKHESRFFKTDKGEYGEGDKFLGIKVPDKRKIAKKYANILDLNEIIHLLKDPIHDYRQIALFLMVYQFSKVDQPAKKRIYQAYLKNTKYINNWDLVDLSAPNIVGTYLLDTGSSRQVLYKLAKSKSLWEQRIAMLATYTFIKQSDFDDALKIAQLLLNHKHDLIHKAVGWMLREIGKKNQQVEEKFLQVHYKKMPRTMLRYAIEKFEENKRQAYLKGRA